MRRTATPEGARSSWWHHTWILLALVAVAWLARYIWPRLFPMNFPFHYPLAIVLLHLVTGHVAMLTACLQLWPWLRRTHPAVHRMSGRLYVFAGALPCSVSVVALVILKGQPTNTSLYLWSALWFATTTAGYRMARQGRRAEHRRWMAYSVAITMGIIWSPLAGELALKYHDHVNFVLVNDLLGWLPWVVNLAFAHWMLGRAGRAAAPAPTDSTPVASTP